MMEMKTRLMISLIFAAVLVANGCGGGPATLRGGADDQTILLERAQAYWEARFMQDMARAFSFEDPLRQKKLSLVGYIRMVGEPGKLYSVAVKGVEIQGDQADVRVEVSTRPPMPPWDKQLLKNAITDDWQKIEGVWYHVLDLHMIRAGKPRVNMERGTIDYPPAESPSSMGTGQSGSIGGAVAAPKPLPPKE